MSHSNHTHKPYSDVRHHMQPGDIIAFGGNSLFSRWAKLTTRSSVTHVAVVIQTKILDETSGRYFNQVIEATDYNGKSGVMINRLSDRVSTYNGDMWWLPLSDDSRNKLTPNMADFFDFLFQQNHKPYDIWQLFGSAVDATDNIPFLKEMSYNSEDFSSWFCSELVAQAFQEGGVINNINASETTPIDVCRFKLYAEEYVQLKGEERKITGINSLDPEDWGFI